MTTTLSRRRFLGSTLASGAALSLAPRFAFATPGAPATGDVIVWLFLPGGMDGLTMVVPHTDAGYYANRPTIAVPPPNGTDRTQGALPLDANFGLHPAMTALYDGPWTAGKMAIVHATGLSDSGNRSHFEAQRFWDAGGPTVAGTAGGWISRYLQTIGASGLVPGVGRSGLLPYSLWGHPEALAIGDVNNFGLEDFPSQTREAARTALEVLYPAGTGDPMIEISNHTLDVYRSIQTANPTAIAPEATYPDHWSRWNFIQTAQLIKANLGIQAVAMEFGSWDHHTELGAFNDPTGTFVQNARYLSENLAAFVADLGTRMNEVTIVIASEFGRTIEENGDAGTDHGVGSATIVIGDNVVGGVHGASRFPGVVQAPTHGDLRVTTDIRSILAEVLRKRSDNPGIDLNAVFPTYTHNVAQELGIIV